MVGASLSLLVPICFLAGCDEITSRQVLAQVEEVTGSAFIVLGGGQQVTRTPVQEGMTVQEGQAIETLGSSTVIISLMPGLFVQIGPDTLLRIEELLVIKSAHAFNSAIKSRQARIRLDRGSLVGTTPRLVTHVDLQISTAAGVFVAPALSSFYVSCDPTKVRGTASRGQLTLRANAGGASQIIQEGNYGEWSAATGETLFKHQKISTDGLADQQSKNALELEVAGAKFDEKARHEPPPGRRSPPR